MAWRRVAQAAHTGARLTCATFHTFKVRRALLVAYLRGQGLKRLGTFPDFSLRVVVQWSGRVANRAGGEIAESRTAHAQARQVDEPPVIVCAAHALNISHHY